METSTLQYRLVTGNIAKQGGQRGSLTRCAQKLGIFQRNLATKQPDPERIHTSKQDLMHDIELFKVELLKLILLQKNLNAQVVVNQNMIEDCQAEIDESLQEVMAGQSEANQALKTKRCFEEYEAVAKVTNELHPRTTWELEQQLGAVLEQIEVLKKEDAAVDHVLTVREGQFQLLIQYITDLKRSFNDVDEQKKLLHLGQQAASGDNGTHGEGTGKAYKMDVDNEEDGLYDDVL